LPGPALQENVVAVLGELARPRRSQGDAVLVVLDLGGDSDDHLLRRSQASSSTGRRTPTISSNCSVSAISGGESWITGSPRSSARQIRPRRGRGSRAEGGTTPRALS